jgi:nucleotide-binding universal stress UspA family protein
VRHNHDEHAARTHLGRHPYLRVRSTACRRSDGYLRTSHGWIADGQLRRASPRPVIVAAFDGTALGREAVIQAGRQAGSRGYVVVVYAYRLPRRCLGRGSSQERLTAARANGRRALEQLLSHRECLPEATYLPELVSGRPSHAIVRIAAEIGADTIVVGAPSAGLVRSAFRRRRLPQACQSSSSLSVVMLGATRARHARLRSLTWRGGGESTDVGRNGSRALELSRVGRLAPRRSARLERDDRHARRDRRRARAYSDPP